MNKKRCHTLLPLVQLLPTVAAAAAVLFALPRTVPVLAAVPEKLTTVVEQPVEAVSSEAEEETLPKLPYADGVLRRLFPGLRRCRPSTGHHGKRQHHGGGDLGRIPRDQAVSAACQAAFDHRGGDSELGGGCRFRGHLHQPGHSGRSAERPDRRGSQPIPCRPSQSPLQRLWWRNLRLPPSTWTASTLPKPWALRGRSQCRSRWQRIKLPISRS